MTKTFATFLKKTTPPSQSPTACPLFRRSQGGSPEERSNQMATITDTFPTLSPDELTSNYRHIIMPEVGMEGQQKLKAARVLCIGAGGLGAPMAFYLAAAGIGTLGLVDFDVVDASNLQRQIIHSTDDIGRSKLD